MDLKAYRKSKGMTQAEFCESVKDIVELNAPLLSAIETGRVEMPPQLIGVLTCEDTDDTLTPTEQIVLEACYQASQDNPVTRSELRDLTSMPDRKARGIIESLRDKGYRIVNNLNGANGYWYGTPEEYRAWLKVYLSYATTIFRRKAAMDRRIEGQIGWVTKEKTEITSSCSAQ